MAKLQGLAYCTRDGAGVCAFGMEYGVRFWLCLVTRALHVDDVRRWVREGKLRD